MNGVARIPEPREWLLTKTCRGCSEAKPWAEFSPATYWPNGSVRTVLSRCRPCETDRKNDARSRRAYRLRNLTEIRQYERDYRRSERRRLTADQAGNGAHLPVEPFRSWLAEQTARFGQAELAAMCGVPARGIRRVLSENDKVSLVFADRCLTARGGHLADLYPVEYEAVNR